MATVLKYRQHLVQLLYRRSYTIVAPEWLGGRLPGKFKKEEKLPDETDSMEYRLKGNVPER